MSDPENLLLKALLSGQAEQIPLSSTAKRRLVEEALEAEPSRLQQLDALLWQTREQELAEEGIPVTLGNLKRTRLISADRIATIWDAWELGTGKRQALKVMRPSCRRDPVWRRRFGRGLRLARQLPGILPIHSAIEEEWPRLWVSIEGMTLADLLPAEDLPESLRIAQFLAGGLRGLRSLHSRGLVHGNVGPDKLVLTASGVGLVWLDGFLEAPGTPRDDIAQLARAVSQLDPEQSDPIGLLAHGWADDPPLSVEMAESVLVRFLATYLTERRHTLLMRSRHVHARQGEARLLRAVRSLALALPPPETTVCLRAGMDSVLVVAESDGLTVRGGGLAALPIRHLPEIWSPQRGLDASASRMLLRSFATRRTGDEARRSEVQRDLQSNDEEAEHLCRWLSAQARLRATTKLLELSRKPR
ncbi:MAG: hypothetical protein VXW32_13370 [Myxococcota bacterium]|nr:hypothetical protein [Myxococcota bacterium]